MTALKAVAVYVRDAVVVEKNGQKSFVPSDGSAWTESVTVVDVENNEVRILDPEDGLMVIPAHQFSCANGEILIGAASDSPELWEQRMEKAANRIRKRLGLKEQHRQLNAIASNANNAHEAEGLELLGAWVLRPSPTVPSPAEVKAVAEINQELIAMGIEPPGWDESKWRGLRFALGLPTEPGRPTSIDEKRAVVEMMGARKATRGAKQDAEASLTRGAKQDAEASLTTREDNAISLVIQHNPPPLTVIAQRVGVARSTLYKWTRFRKTAELAGLMKPRGKSRRMVRGSKVDGQIDAYVDEEAG